MILAPESCLYKFSELTISQFIPGSTGCFASQSILRLMKKGSRSNHLDLDPPWDSKILQNVSFLQNADPINLVVHKPT